MSVRKFEYAGATWSSREGEPEPSPEEIEKLAIDIRDNGLHHPILVAHLIENDEFIGLDGLHRVEAYKLLGWSQIDAFVTPVFDEALDRFSSENEGREFNRREIGRLVQDFDRLLVQRKILPHTQRSKELHTRYGHAFRFTSSDIRTIRRAQMIVKGGLDYAVVALEEYYRGAITHIVLKKRISQRDGGRNIPARQAASLVKASQRTLLTTLDQLDRIERFNEMSLEDLNEARATFNKIYSLLSIVTRRLRSEKISVARNAETELKRNRN